LIKSNVNNGKKASHSINGTVLAVEDVSIDLQQRQGDNEKVIDVCLDNQLQTMREGLGAWYVATVVVPPKQTEIYDTGETDENGDAIYDERVLPLDMSKVELRLWGLPEEYGKTNLEGDEV